MRKRTKLAVALTLAVGLVVAPASAAEADEECTGIIDLVLGCIVGEILDPVIPDEPSAPPVEPEPIPVPEAPAPQPAPAPAVPIPAPAPAPVTPPAPSASTGSPTDAPKLSWKPQATHPRFVTGEDMPPVVIPTPAPTTVVPTPAPTIDFFSQSKRVGPTESINEAATLKEKIHPIWVWFGVVGVLALASVSLSCLYLYQQRRTR